MARYNTRPISYIEEKVNEFGYKLLDIYTVKSEKESIKRVIIEDEDGYKNDCNFSILENNIGSSRKFHPKNIFTIYNISLFLKINNFNYTLLDNQIYLGTHSPLLFCCNDYGHIFPSPLESILTKKRKCAICTGNLVGEKTSFGYLHDNLVIEWIESENNFTPYEVTEFSKEKVYWQCSKNIEHQWWAIVASRSSGTGCPFCSGIRVSDKNRLSITHPDIAKEWHPARNKELKPEDVCYGSSRKVWWLCSNCGNEWLSSIYPRTGKENCGCPNCNQSKREKDIFKFLNENNIRFISQYKFKDCINIRPLPFDFYLPDYNCCIEGQGEQHFEPIDFSGKGLEWAQKEFEENQIRDQIKRDYCYENGINLLEIPYWEFDNGNAKNILIDYLDL